jgi:type IV pilus assembly protein PilX
MLMPAHGRLRPGARQRGVVLMIALIVLVAMTLAGIALMRSVDTTTIIAGNLAFQQSATSSGDTGTEAAATWLKNTGAGGGAGLWNNIPAQGYMAQRQDPAAGQSWDAFWNAVINPSGGPSLATTLTQDANTGNTVAYVIQRLCNAQGDPTSPGVDCAAPQTSTAASSSSKGAGTVALLYNSAIYYRITTRIDGPRNTVSYVQVVVTQ